MQGHICIAPQGESFRLALASSLHGTSLSGGSIRLLASGARKSYGKRGCLCAGATASAQDPVDDLQAAAEGQQQAVRHDKQLTLSTRRNILATAGALGTWMFSGKASAADVSTETMASGFLMFDDSDIPASKFFRIERIDKGVFRLERIEEGVPAGPSSPPQKPKVEAAAPAPSKVEPPAPAEAKVELPKEEPKVELPKEEPKVELPKEEPKVEVEPPKAASPPPKVEAPKVEAPKVEAPKVEAPKVEVEVPKAEAPKVEAPKAEAPKVETPPSPAPAPPPKAAAPPPEPETGIKDDAAKRVLELYKKQQQEAAATKAAAKPAPPPPAPVPVPPKVVPEVVKAAPPSAEDSKSMENTGRWAMIAASVGVAGWLLTSATRSSMEDAASASTPAAPSPTPTKPVVRSASPTSSPPVAASTPPPVVNAAAPQKPTSTDSQRDALKEMSMAELRALARSLGLRGDTKMEIINAIIAVSAAPPKPAPVVSQTLKTPTVSSAPPKATPTVAAFVPPVKAAKPTAADEDELFDALNAKTIAELRMMAREKGVRGDTKKELIQELLKASLSGPVPPPVVKKAVPKPATVPVTNGAAATKKPPTTAATELEKMTPSYTPAGPPSKADQGFNADIALKSMAELRSMARARGLRGDTRKELETALMKYQEQHHSSPDPTPTPISPPKSYTNGAVKTVPKVSAPPPVPVKVGGSLNEAEVERLMEKTMGELRAMARERGVRGDTKKELIDILSRT